MTLDNYSTRGIFFFESRPIDPDWKDNIRRIISTLLLNQWEPVEKWSYASINFVSGISILSCIFQLAIQCNSKFHSKWLKNGHSIIQMTIWKQNLNSQIPSTEKQSKWPLFFKTVMCNQSRLGYVRPLVWNIMTLHKIESQCAVDIKKKRKKFAYTRSLYQWLAPREKNNQIDLG